MRIQYFSQFKGLSCTVYIVSAARAINAMGAFVTPMLTMLTMLLTEKTGLGISQAGSVVLLVTLSYTPGSLLGGYFSDKFNKQTIILIAQLTAVIALIV